MPIEFNSNKPIFRQIADTLCDRILDGTYPPGGRIPSVRELGASLEVNINTAMRSIEYLQQRDVIYNRRGIGNFVSDDAATRIRDIRRHTFLEDEIGYFYSQLASLDITPDELSEMYSNYLNNRNK